MPVTAAVAAVAGAVGTVAVGASEASSQAGIANSQEALAGQASNQSATLFGEQQGYAGMLNKLISNPGSVTSLPGYAFNQQQGEQAVARQMAGSGFLNSGNEATALTQYGQNYAMGAYNNQVSVLSSLAGLGQSATAGLNTSSGALSGASSASASSANSLQGVLATLGFTANGGLGGLYGGTPNGMSGVGSVASGDQAINDSSWWQGIAGGGLGGVPSGPW